MFEPPERFNIAHYFLTARLEEGRGDRVALRTEDGELTYRAVDQLANRFANALRELGVRQEERVLIALPDTPEFVAALFGGLKLGAVCAFVNPEMATATLAGILSYTRARIILVDRAAVEAFEAAAREAGQVPRLLLVEGEAGGHASLADLDVADSCDTVPTHRDDPAIWLFSGGTTGRPKAAVQTHRSFANATECYARRAVGYHEDDVTMSVPRLHFGYATGANLLFPFAVGACSALYRAHPTVDVVFDQIRRHRPTILVNVPKMIRDMVDHPAAADQDLSCLRFAISAGEALPAMLYERWRATFGVELYDGLGTAEMWHIFVSNLPGQVRPGTLGKPVPGYEVRVRDEEGTDLADGQVGRLWVRGNSRAIGYWQDMPRSKDVFRGEWAVLGDLVRREPDGFIAYVGRADEALKVGGKWLLPAEVEGVLLQHELVRECAVVGVPDDAGLTVPVAFVVADRPPSDVAEQLKAFVIERLEPYKHPRDVVVVEDLPRTHLGKVDRGALRSAQLP